MPYHELVQFLHAFQIVVKSFDEILHKELLKTFECFSNVLCHSKSISRHLASKCYASLASVKRNETITGQFSQIMFYLLQIFMPCPLTGPKMFCAGPNFLSQPKNVFTYCGSHKHFVPDKKMICIQ